MSGEPRNRSDPRPTGRRAAALAGTTASDGTALTSTGNPTSTTPHLLIRASAGTGKTFQLTNRLLKLLVAGIPLESILAVTFTRKAAGEIADRLLVRLAGAALEQGACAELGRHLGCPSLTTAEAGRVLLGLLRQIHRLRVSTLDAFFLQLGRPIGSELGLPSGWQIVEEVVDRRLRAQAIQDVLADESAQSATRLVHLLTKGEATRSVSQQIGLLVADLYSLYMESPGTAWEAVPRYRLLRPEALESAIMAVEKVDLSEQKRMGAARDADLEQARREDWTQFLSTGLAAKIADGTEQYYGKPIPAELVESYLPLLHQAKAVLVGQIANQTEATYRLLRRFDEAYRLRKFARRELRFEDVTRALAESAAEGVLEDAGRRLGLRLDHLLLDEFQDTAPQQWRVLRPLAGRIVPGNGHQSFFCVGDVKQAIYGWRGGMAEIFDALEEQLKPLVAQTLDESRRSSPVVIEVVNRVFTRIAENPVLAKEPQAAAAWQARFLPHTTARSELPGYCRLIAGPRAGEGIDSADLAMEFAASHVAELHRRAPGRSIGVLVRRNAAVARLIYELRRLDIRASEEGGNPLTDSPAVQLVLSLLKFADHPGDTAARFHVARSPLGASVGLTDPSDADGAWRISREIRRLLMTRGYGPTLDRWAGELRGHCDGRDGNRLAQLVEMGYGYEARASTRVDDFLEVVAQRRVGDPSDAPIRVMTIHQAKGLQFDAVVLPELDAPLVGQPPQIVVGRTGLAGAIARVCRYVAKDLRPLLPKGFAEMFDHQARQMAEESLCVLYVALTRAVHCLDLLIAPSRENERTIPCTYAGLLRAALTGTQPGAPDTVLFELGDPNWSGRETTDATPAAPPMPAELDVEPPPELPPARQSTFAWADPMPQPSRAAGPRRGTGRKAR